MECFLRATSPDACRNFLVTARFFRFHRDCGKIEIWCWGSDRDGISRCSICVAGWGWDLPVLHRVFFPFFFLDAPDRVQCGRIEIWRSTDNGGGTLTEPIDLSITFYVWCFFSFFFSFCIVQNSGRRKIYKRQISILYNSWKRLPFRLD